MHKTKHKTATRHYNHATRGLNGDIAKIRHALADAKKGVRLTANKLMTRELSELRGKKELIQDGIEEYVLDKPLKSIGIAILTGVAIGLFMRK